MRDIDPGLKAMTREDVWTALASRTLSGAQAADWYLSEPVAHHEGDRVLAILTDCERSAADQPFRILIGATGVGKSTYMRMAHNVVNYQHREERLRDPLLLASILVEIASPDGKKLTAASFYEPLLKAVNAPPVSGCLPPAPPGLPQIWLPKRIQVAEPLAERVIRMVAPRRPYAIFMDEGKNIMWQQDAEDIERHFNRLKTVGNNIGSFITLAMANDGLKLWMPDAQLVRRIEPVHFRRYGPGSEDQERFEAALTKLIDRLPLPAAFAPKLELFYPNTNGCIGVLADWLGRALKLAVEQGSDCVRGEHVLAEVLPFAEVSALLRDALDAETHPWTRPTRPTVAEWEAHLEALGLQEHPRTPSSPADPADEGTASEAQTRRQRAARAGDVPRPRRKALRSRRPRDEQGDPIPGTTEVDALHALRDFEPAPRRHPTGMHPEDADAVDAA